MADRHYGYDVSVVNISRTGSNDDFSSSEILRFESIDFSVDPTMKESTAAQDVGPNRRVIGTDFSLSLNKFVEGNFAALANRFSEDVLDYKNITLVITFTIAGTGSGGADARTLTLTNCVCTKTGFNLGGEATKESLEFKRGTGSFAWSNTLAWA